MLEQQKSARFQTHLCWVLEQLLIVQIVFISQCNCKLLLIAVFTNVNVARSGEAADL